MHGDPGRGVRQGDVGLEGGWTGKQVLREEDEARWGAGGWVPPDRLSPLPWRRG